MKSTLIFTKQEVMAVLTPFITKKTTSLGQIKSMDCEPATPALGPENLLLFAITFKDPKEIVCPKCGSSNCTKRGFNASGTQAYECKDCDKKFSESRVGKTQDAASSSGSLPKEHEANDEIAPSSNELETSNKTKKMDFSQASKVTSLTLSPTAPATTDVNKTRLMCGLPANIGTSKEAIATNPAILDPKTLSTPTSTSPDKKTPDLDFLSLTAENMNNFIWSHHEQKKSPLEISEILRSKGLEWTEHMVENRLNKIKVANFKAKEKK